MIWNINSSVGFYECELIYWFRKLSHKIDIAIDVGAADGFYTLYFLLKTSAKKVFSFEPDEEARKLLTKNLKLNGIENTAYLEIIPQFVDDFTSQNTITLNDAVQSEFRQCLIKVDVEGKEVEVLQGASRFLNSSNVSWTIETHSYENEKKCIKILTQAKFDVKVISPAWWRCILPEYRPLPHNRWLTAFPT